MVVHQPLVLSLDLMTTVLADRDVAKGEKVFKI